MIDEEGYRLNVGIVLANQHGQLLWGRRIGTKNAWQFPQGGMALEETPQQAMYRELTEELGLDAKDVTLIAETKDWLFYSLPERYRRYDSLPLCIGQKQKWFLLRLESDDSKIRLDLSTNPEFDSWCWVDYWYPINQVIEFKQAVYQQVLSEFENKI